MPEEFEGQFTCLGENIKKYITISVLIEKEVSRIDKKGKKSQKQYLTDYNVLIAQNCRLDRYQILLIILMKKFIKLNVNMDMIIKKAKRKYIQGSIQNLCIELYS